MQTLTQFRQPALWHSLALLLAGLWLAPLSAQAVTCTSNQTGNWNAIATWSGCTGGNGTPINTPGSNDTAIIQGGHTVTVNGTFTVAAVNVDAPGSNGTSQLNVGSNSLNVAGAVTLTGGAGNRFALLSISTGTLTVNGNLTPSGNLVNAQITFTGAGALNIRGSFGNGGTYTASTGTVTYDGAGAQNVGAYNYHNLTIAKSDTASLTGNITLGNNLTVTTGTLNLSTFTANRGVAGGALTVANGATLSIGGTNSFPSNYTNSTMGAGSTVSYSGANQSITSGLTYGHLTLDGAAASTKTPAAGTITVAGNFTVQGTATTYAGTANNPIVNLAGNLINNGTFNSGTGAFTFNAAVAQTISGNATSLGNLVIDNTSAAGVTVGNTTPLAIGTFTIPASRIFNAGASSGHSISGNFTNNGTFNAGTSTFTFNGTAVQSLSGASAMTFNHLTMNNTAGLATTGLTIDGATAIVVTVNNTLTFTNGKITTGNNAPPGPYQKTLTVGGACNANTGASQTTGWVVGNLKKTVAAPGPTTCNFDVGGTTYYSPITVEFPTVSTTGTMTGAAMPHAGDGHPNISGTDINPTRNVNRFWTLKDATVVFTSYNATFTYNPLDLDALADPLEFVIRRYSAPYPATGTWSTVTVDENTTPPANSIIGTGITGTGDFAVGNSTISAFLREREWVYTRELYYQQLE